MCTVHRGACRGRDLKSTCTSLLLRGLVHTSHLAAGLSPGQGQEAGSCGGICGSSFSSGTRDRQNRILTSVAWSLCTCAPAKSQARDGQGRQRGQRGPRGGRPLGGSAFPTVQKQTQIYQMRSPSCSHQGQEVLCFSLRPSLGTAREAPLGHGASRHRWWPQAGGGPAVGGREGTQAAP